MKTLLNDAFKQWRRHGGQGGQLPPLWFWREKRRRGEKKKREGGKKGGEKKKKKGKKERKKTNKQKTRLWHFACKITPFSNTNFQKFSLSDGSPLGRSLPRFDALLTNPVCTTRPITGTAKGHKHPSTHAPSYPLIGVKATLKGGVEGWYIMPLHGITYPLIMAINVQENDVFTVHEFSKSPSLPFPARSFII